MYSIQQTKTIIIYPSKQSFYTHRAFCICLNCAIFESASSSKKIASFIKRLMKRKNNGGFTASIFCSASLAKFLKYTRAPTLQDYLH